MIYKCANAYYFNTLSKIGGIESHFFYMAKKYHQYDIVFFYRTGDPDQVKRISKYAKCIRLDPADKIVCDTMFCCFNREVLDQCKAKKICLILHGDYKDMVERGQLKKQNLPLDDRVDQYLGVSQLVCDSWKELTGKKAKCIYEPVILENNDDPLFFVSATRLSKEKGWERMVKLAEELNKNGINYKWFIYTNTPKQPVKNMVFMEPELDLNRKMSKYDAFIQLSDNEGFCLSVVEALMRKIPVIVTDLPVFKEIGLNEKNSIILNKNMDKIPVDKIRNVNKLKFSYEPPEDKWEEHIVKKKTDYKPETFIKAAVIQSYFDIEMKRAVNVGEIVEFDQPRIDKLKSLGLIKVIKNEK